MTHVLLSGLIAVLRKPRTPIGKWFFWHWRCTEFIGFVATHLFDTALMRVQWLWIPLAKGHAEGQPINRELTEIAVTRGNHRIQFDRATRNQPHSRHELSQPKNLTCIQSHGRLRMS